MIQLRLYVNVVNEGLLTETTIEAAQLALLSVDLIKVDKKKESAKK